MKSTMLAFYDLSIGPVSYDFITFLVRARMAANDYGRGELHVVFVFDPDTKYRQKLSVYSHDEAEWRFNNICVPACGLVGATHTVAMDWNQAKFMAAQLGVRCWPLDWDRQTLKRRHHLVGEVVSHCGGKDYHDDPCILRASNHARTVMRQHSDSNRNGRKFVTMTYRNTGYVNGRDVDTQEWKRAFVALQDRGYDVYAISDVSTTLRLGFGFCELSLDLRMAAYELADMNIVANTGPASLCWFSKKPYLMMDAGVGDTRAEWEGLFVKQGLPWGETWAWAKPGQKIVYERSTCQNILKEFDAWATATK